MPDKHIIPELTKNELKNLASFYVSMGSENLTIVRYDVLVPETKTSRKVLINNTTNLSEQTKRELSYLKPDDDFIIQNIMAKQNDSTYVTGNMIRFKVKE